MPLGVLTSAVSAGSRRRWIIGATTLIAIAAEAVAFTIHTGDDAPPVVVPNSLVKIDAESNRIVDVVPVGRNPGDVAVVGGYVFVSS